MSLTTNAETYINIEQLNTYYTYLDTILPILSDIYKCPCKSCITENTVKIESMITNIKKFYYFIIDCKAFIHKNESYLKQIKELIPNMITFNNVIIKDIDCINTQIGVSIIYVDTDTLESETINKSNSIFNLDTLFQYYPELRVEFM